MQRKACTQDRTDDDLVRDLSTASDSERRLHITLRIVELLTQLIGHNLADALDIATEAHSILLYLYIAHLCDEVAEERVLLDEVLYFH